jgi:8-oxo-dGTP pyrophosphatase MutT (NUDIX family)
VSLHKPYIQVFKFSQLTKCRLPSHNNTSHFYNFHISPYSCSFGYMLENVVKSFTWSAAWEVDHAKKTVRLLATSLDERNQIIASTLKAEHEKKTFKVLSDWRGEMFAIYGPGHELVLSMERTGAPLFGIATYGIQLLAWEQHAEGPRLWIAKRAKTKRRFPTMLDSTVGGCLPTGESPFECLVREAGEEASIPAEVIRKHAKACGTLNYIHVTDERSGGELGLISPEVQFLYEMERPADLKFEPRDGEVEKFVLCGVEEVMERLRNGEFTPANGCVVLDFLIRHGIITYESERDYIQIASRLHRSLPFPTR